ncbi:MAG TPA: low molecular weight protein-tyrosine-phosphatase [Casimicrobiaceae bacterium]|nr:low molecular weight protein-tyrosine-phosphatase [Casimicrobiaceae bacterium]
MNALFSKPESPRPGVLFVCLGNICRSPTAEAVFRERALRAGLAHRLTIASAGTGDWHVGEPPDRRAILHGRKRGYDLSRLRAQQVSRAHFDKFDWILAMDRSNLRVLSQLKPAEYAGRLGLFLDFAPHLGVKEVPDPYYGGTQGFEQVLDLIEQASDALIEQVRLELRDRE